MGKETGQIVLCYSSTQGTVIVSFYFSIYRISEPNKSHNGSMTKSVDIAYSKYFCSLELQLTTMQTWAPTEHLQECKHSNLNTGLYPMLSVHKQSRLLLTQQDFTTISLPCTSKAALEGWERREHCASQSPLAQHCIPSMCYS